MIPENTIKPADDIYTITPSKVFVLVETDSNLLVDGKLSEYKQYKQQLNPEYEYLIYFDKNVRRWILKEEHDD